MPRSGPDGASPGGRRLSAVPLPGWLAEARALGGEIRRVDEALREAEESTRLNPRSLRLPHTTVNLWQCLETLEHIATAVRVLARSLADSAGLAGRTARRRPRCLTWAASRCGAPALPGGPAPRCAPPPTAAR